MNDRRKNDDLTRFIPTSRAEMEARGWQELDVLFVSGDAYVDHPAFGVPLLARWLESLGYRVGIIAQPDWRRADDFLVMGRPRLCVAISSGAMDSMVNHYTAARKKRRDDAYTPGGQSGARPNRAIIAYTAAVKGALKGVPVIIGGIEASLRRLAHYDYWSDQVRRSVLIDSKADLLVYGMGETALATIVRRLDEGEPVSAMSDIRGTAWVTKTSAEDAVCLPDYEEVEQDSAAYAKAFAVSEQMGQKTQTQRHGSRCVVVNPPAAPLEEAPLDALYALPFTRRPHFSYTQSIPAFEQIRWSVTSHRGCQGGCAFCAIARHQGRRVQSRSQSSVVDEVRQLSHEDDFRGTISDVGGPTANMYGITVENSDLCGPCQRTSCLFPNICRNLQVRNGRAARLLRRVREIKGVKHVFVASGVRYDLLEQQSDYLNTLLEHHVGGLLKVAPEALSDPLLKVMRKPAAHAFGRFVEAFRADNRRRGKRRGIVPYLMAGHPGSTLNDMVDTALFLKRYHLRVEQVQEFTPTPGTLATCMYHTGIDPFTGHAVEVCRSEKQRRWQKALLLYHLPASRKAVLEALQACGREQDSAALLGGGRERSFVEPSNRKGPHQERLPRRKKSSRPKRR
ncbi:YgiQ family radical SAM protein [uncultured Desulfuromonas sp.]|uniref:YgiQ family radical SAM protein n=1 Tax=uncultured Desulfuromonas sp. TaxID=181013 RepID=UPI002AAC42B6|nr:YgiQ family radical SAM protein [uncultured Desulfuromonas sp.]